MKNYNPQISLSPIIFAVIMKIKEAVFVVSNSDISKCPTDEKNEFAFIGRSNVGKSSLINMLTGKKNLAKTSGTPGKTQLINHFLIDEKSLHPNVILR